MIELIETNSKGEAKALHRYLSIRNKRIIASNFILMSIVIVGFLALAFGGTKALQFFIFYIIFVSTLLIIKNVSEIFNHKPYGLSHYPLKLTFDDNEMCVTSATGMRCAFLWKNINDIKIGKLYLNLYTDVGIYRIKLVTFGDRHFEIIGLWNRGKFRKAVPKVGEKCE